MQIANSPTRWSKQFAISTRNAAFSGWGLALASTFASSIVTPIVRGAVVNGMNPITLLLMRLLIATLLLAGTMAVFEPENFKIDRRGLWLVGVIGLISGIEICCFFWSLEFVDASMSAMIKSTQPLVVLLFLMLGGERLTRRSLVRLLLAMIGVYLLIGGPGGHIAPMGMLLLGLSLILYAAQLVLSQWWLRGYGTSTVTFYLTAIMTLVIIGWWWAQGITWQTPAPQDWLIIIVLAVVCTYFARLALYAAIPRVGSGQIALLWPLQTLTIIGLSVLFLHERMTPVQWLGGVFVLASALLAIERRHRRVRPISEVN
ncbi:MAG: DMT family transporter [Chloroflexi bacterium]|nr:DMT family transporter [Chloroflexota bacterium]